MQRTVTEQDFRAPEYQGAKPEDYEFRADGVLVRKDRWERGMREIADILQLATARTGFEIADVVEAVAHMKHRMDGLDK